MANEQPRIGAVSQVVGALRARRLRRGHLVEVRTPEEIQATLDSRGCLENLPFMPEMLSLCGRRVRVLRRVQLTCVEGFDERRWHRDTVALEGVRCDGSAHGGCQRGCLILWKEEWLSKVGGGRGSERSDDASAGPHATACTVLAASGARQAVAPVLDGTRFFCQSSQLQFVTAPCKRWARSQLLIDSLNGNISIGDVTRHVSAAVRRRVLRLLGRAVPEQEPTPGVSGATPTESLDLQPGDLVQVRSLGEIQETLDQRLRNRGLTFEDCMVPLCGRRFRVGKRIERIVLEETGTMRTLRDTVALEGVTCPNCVRSNVLYWREIWLKRLAT